MAEISPETAKKFHIADRLGELFGGGGSIDFDHTKKEAWYVARPDPIKGLGQLLEAAKLLECAPEEFFFEADIETDGYCETCYSEYPVLRIWVERKGA